MIGRRLTWIAISFLLGIIVCRYKELWLYGVCALWFISIGILFWLEPRQGQGYEGKKQVHTIIKIIVCMLFLLLGYFRQEEQQTNISEVEVCLSEEVWGQVYGSIYKKEEKNDKIHYYLKDSFLKRENHNVWVGRILIYSKTDVYSIGDTIFVKGICKSFEEACNEGNFDARQYYYCKNIMGYMNPESMDLVKKVKLPWKECLYNLRKKLQQVYVQMLPEKEAGILSLMTIGDKEIVDEEVKELYQQSGVGHLNSISGLHVSCVGFGIYQFLRKRKFSYWYSGVISGMLVFCFGQMSGMELSTLRAVVMFGVMLLGNALGMAYDSVSALSLAAMLQLWENPYCLWHAGFQFSYGAVLAVVVVWKLFGDNKDKMLGQEEKEVNVEKKENAREKAKRKKIKREKNRKLEKVGREIKDTFLLSGCIQLVTLPLTIYYYYEFPVYTVLVNTVLLPFMGIVLVSGLLGGLAGVFLTEISWLSWLVLQPAEWLLKWNEQVCNLVGNLPKAVWITGKPPLWSVVVYYSLLIVVLIVLYRKKQQGSREKQLEDREKGQESREKQRCALVVLVIVLTGFVLLPSPKEFQICFLDVGQGDGIYIQTKEGADFFIDGGSTSENKVGKYRMLPFLKCRGVSKIEGWFVSHADADHTSGLQEVWENGYKIETLFLAKEMPKDEAWEKLCTMAEQYGTKIVYLAVGDSTGTASLNIECLAPWQMEEDRNEASMVLKLEYVEAATESSFTGIFAGDISKEQEKLLLEKYPSLDVDLYKAIHHGSNGSNSAEFLEQLSPVVSVVSCSADNSYGHPGKEAVNRIEAVGSRIFYTMYSGQITVGIYGKSIVLKEFNKKE